jgi:hypothetical protein
LLALDFQSRADAVGHPPQPLPDVRRADAVCAQYRRPAGVAFAFQVSKYKIEPAVPNRAFNLLSKHCFRAALSNKPVELGPKVALVGVSFLLSGEAERLTGA